MSPVLMAVNYADKVSAVQAVSQKTRLVEVLIKCQGNRGEYIEFSFPHASGEEQSWVLKLVLAGKMQ